MNQLVKGFFLVIVQLKKRKRKKENTHKLK